MPIVLDNREHGLIAELPSAEVRQLSVGDAWITDLSGNPQLVIERKTTADFEASFLDGRYREQRTRLLSFCQQHKARAMYILEGGVQGPLRKLTTTAVQKLVHRLMLRYHVAVWSTNSTFDTAHTLLILSDQLKDDPKVFEAEQVSYTDVMATTKKANLDDPKSFAIGALQGCPGVSARGAEAIYTVYGSLKAILETEEKTLADVKVGGRRLGPAVAKRLLALLK